MGMSGAIPPSSSILPRILDGGGRGLRGELRLPPRPEEYEGGGARDSWEVKVDASLVSLSELEDEDVDDGDAEGDGVGFGVVR